MSAIEQLSTDELYGELSAARLAGYSALNAHRGKFVTFGHEIALVVPYISSLAGHLSPGFSANVLRHSRLQQYGHGYPTATDTPVRKELYDRVKDVVEHSTFPTLESHNGAPTVLTDAGMFSISSANSVLIYSESLEFGRADDAGREQTAALFEKMLGNEFSVQLGDH